MRRFTAAVGTATLVALSLIGCSSGRVSTLVDPATGLPVLRVVASFGPLAELAQRVGGSAVQLTNLTKAGVEPHDLEMNSKQIDAIQDAALVVYVGDGFQAAVDDAVKSRKGPSLDLLTRIDPIAAEPGGDSHSPHDPHFWLDPQRMATAAQSFSDEMSKVDPDRAKQFATNTSAYVAELKQLNDEFTAGLTTCKLRTFVTAHAAFGYLALRYNLKQVSVTGISPDIEPDPARLSKVADLMKSEGVGTILTEELVSPKVAEALARETGAKTAVLSPIEGFTDDEIKAGATYASKMRENLNVLESALRCS
jgi:zinc transport system substrate-binding protein